MNSVENSYEINTHAFIQESHQSVFDNINNTFYIYRHSTMLCLYINILIIGHACSGIYRILHVFELKRIAKFHENDYFRGQKCKNTTTKQKSKHKNPCQNGESNSGPLNIAVCSVTPRPMRKLNISIEDKLFNCFNVMVHH